MYEWAGAIFEEHGYVQYEISNWALDDGRLTIDHNPSSVLHGPWSTVHAPPSFACRHNLQYWRSLPYLAFGAGAHGYANGYRYSNALRIKTYIDRLANPGSRIAGIEFPLSPATVNQHKQSLKDDMSEFMMTGLRLTREGVSYDEFEKRFGKLLTEVYEKEIDELLKLGLVERISVGADGRPPLRLTPRGRLLGNQVFMRFV
jgi:oxygen-independent coproporphyrinogen-3 oxidase